jgi:transcriptional regulator with XRE-family HTH domain
LAEEGIGKRLKELRKKCRKTAKQVALEVGVSDSTYRDWEYGRRILGEPYGKLAKSLDTSLIYLILGESSDRPKIHENLRRAEELIRASRIAYESL